MTLHFNATHGMTKAPEFNTWSHMLQRCSNPRNKSFKHYGARGITVCDRWLSFANFLGDMGFRPTPSHSLDRVDVNGNYEPANCRWATPKEQASNTRRNVKVRVGEELVTVSEAARLLGVPRETIKSRIRRGASAALAISTPVRTVTSSRRGVRIEYGGQSHTASEWAKIVDVPLKTLLYRLKAGWSNERALTTRVSTNLIQL